MLAPPVLRRFLAIVVLASLALPATVSAADDPYKPGPMLEQFLNGPMAGVEEIVFAVRVAGRDHWYVTFGNYAGDSEDPQRLAFKFEEGVYWGYGEGGRLCRLNLRTGALQVLLEDAKGGIRDPQLHYGGQKILFSYRPGGTHVFHLYEIGIEGTGLVQLTDGPDDDIEPCYCPDGSIVFCSSRCRRFVNCWHTRVAALYRCEADGKNVRMLSSNNDHDNTPWVLPDGRVLYMRWEYVDRSQVHYHHLWTAAPDGTGQTVFFGNLHPGIAMLDAKPIPGSDKVVASFSPGHGAPEHRGYVTVVDPSRGPDAADMALRITKDPAWKDPWAFDEHSFLAVRRDGIYVLDDQGNKELVYQLPSEDRERFECHEPRPLAAHAPERIIPDRANPEVPGARLVLEDVYAGRQMAAVERGTVKKLLVLKQLPKQVNFSGGMQPLTIGGTFTLAEILGTVPVEEDGSASFEVPALQSLFFVALDAQDRPVKRMHSFAVLQPGETTTCVGCHEPRSVTPRPVRNELAALARSPSPIERLPGIPAVFDFPRDIQPILDKHCTSCHNSDQYAGKVDLSGDKTPMYTIAYVSMRTHNLVSDGRNVPQSNYLPYENFSAASKLMEYLDGGHYDARLTAHERDMIRLWIDSSAVYPGTYASLGCGYYPAYLPFGAMKERCGGCHGKELKDDQGKPYYDLVFRRGSARHSEVLANISRPEKAFLLTAPLAKEAGGLALCKEPVFRDTSDPLYVQIRAALDDAHRRLEEGKRFDMPGFRPNQHYLREMQNWGFIPKDLKPGDPVDCYAVDRAYWDSFTYEPERP